MKKLICALTTLALCAAMSVTAFAANSITAINGTDSANVIASYQAGSSASTVYSVDITWGSMQFTYTAGSEGTWDPETHAYNNATTGTWSNVTNSNKITVTNHSNAAVDAALSYTAVATYSAISGAFTEASGTANDNKLALATAQGTTVENAPAASATLNLSGELASGVTNTKIGTITVTITEQFGVDGGEGSLDGLL